MKRTPLERRTPLAKKSTKPRRKPAVRCSYGPRCKRRPSVIVSDTERLCTTHATWTADKLVGDFVRHRDGRCILADFNDQPCYHPETLYWCHLIPKGRYPSVRYVALNAVAGCARHHEAFDRAPLEKERWIYAHLGLKYDDLKLAALSGVKRDIGDVIRLYRAKVAA